MARLKHVPALKLKISPALSGSKFCGSLAVNGSWELHCVNSESIVKETKNTDTFVRMYNNLKNITAMQTSLFEINLFVPATTPENISKSKHSTSTITAYMSDEDVDWGDIYDEYEDFSYCNQAWA